MRIGFGSDVHRLVENRELILAGVKIPFHKGLWGHSDADVLTHSIIDALLGAVGMRDIGTHFPDTDNKYKDIESIKLLQYVCLILEEKGYTIGNIDTVIVAEEPRLSPYIEKMRANLADIMHIDKSQINIKATTEEGIGIYGEGKAMAAQAVCLLEETK